MLCSRHEGHRPSRDWEGPSGSLLEQVADPEPGPGEAVVALRAAALNHRDAWIRKGLYAGITLPIILGSDGAGEVAAVGAGVDRSWVGRHVVINPSLGWGADARVQGPSYRILGLPDNGTYAERVKVPAENLFAKPAALSWEAAAAIPLAGLTAYRALVTRARVAARRDGAHHRHRRRRRDASRCSSRATSARGSSSRRAATPSSRAPASSAPTAA